jgi:hypothetical protein
MPVGLRALSVVALLSLLTGCSASKGNVTLQGETGRTIYAQSFNKAYISKSHDGEYDVILIQDPLVSRASKGGNKPLQPLAAASLRQIVHIHVFWRGDGGSVARDGVVTNSAIDWYVIAHEASDRPEVLRYEGAGYVLLNPGRNGTSVEIRDGSMKKTESHGDLRDPLGPARLTGTVKAQQNSQFVRDTLEDLKSQTATAKTAVTLR